MRMQMQQQISHALHRRPVKVVIGDGDSSEDVVIKISDEGGGIKVDAPASHRRSRCSRTPQDLATGTRQLGPGSWDQVAWTRWSSWQVGSTDHTSNSRVAACSHTHGLGLECISHPQLHISSTGTRPETCILVSIHHRWAGDGTRSKVQAQKCRLKNAGMA